MQKTHNFMKLSSGYRCDDNQVYNVSYIRYLIKQGDLVNIINYGGYDITKDELLKIINDDKEVASLLTVEILCNIIKLGSVSEYRKMNYGNLEE